MTKREKILAACIGLLVAAIFGYMVTSRIASALQTRRGNVTNLEGEIRKKELKIRAGQKAAQRIAQYEARSLPPSRGKANSRYRAWLSEIAFDAGLQAPSIKPMGDSPYRGIYEEHKVQLSASGNLEELTVFLYDFYAVARMHRIRSLSVTPTDEGKELKLVFQIDAASLPTSPHLDSLPTQPSHRLKLASLDDYKDSILNRNLFGPPNSPPRFASTRARDAYPNQSYSWNPSPRDPDGDKVQVEVVPGENELPGLRVGDDGTISGTPEKLGEYFVTLRIWDDGTPSKAVQQEFRIPVVEPPPPVVRGPDFDIAQFAKLTGITRSNGRRLAWIYVRTEGRQLKLYEGDRLQVGSVDGIVTRIDPLQCQIESEGRRLILSLGDFLTDAEVLSLGE